MAIIARSLKVQNLNLMQNLGLQNCLSYKMLNLEIKLFLYVTPLCVFLWVMTVYVYNAYGYVWIWVMPQVGMFVCVCVHVWVMPTHVWCMCVLTCDV